MNRVKLLMIFLFVSAALVISPGATASEYNKKTIVTFGQPVEIPGVGAQVLPAGTYVIRLVDSLSTRDIVQILNKDETHVYATILAVANYRLKPTSDPVIRFRERAAGSPQALRAWFYPGNTFGQEFVYPKARALEIAKEVNQPVLTMPSELATEITAPEPSAAPTEALKEAPIKAVEPSGEEVEIAQVIPPQTAKTWPKTASLMPLLGLMGLVSLALAAALSLFLKRTA